MKANMPVNTKYFALLWGLIYIHSGFAADVSSGTCPQVPAGAIVVGKYCPAPIVADTSKTQAPGEGVQMNGAVQMNQSNSAVSVPFAVPPLLVRQGQRLMPALKEWLANQSIELVWAATSSSSGRVRDVVLEVDFESSSSRVGDALTEILMPFGFEAEIAQNSGSIKRVTVRNARNGL